MADTWLVMITFSFRGGAKIKKGGPFDDCDRAIAAARRSVRHGGVNLAYIWDRKPDLPTVGRAVKDGVSLVDQPGYMQLVTRTYLPGGSSR